MGWRIYRWKVVIPQVNLAVGGRRRADGRWNKLSGWMERRHQMSRSRWRITVLVGRWRGPIKQRVHCQPCDIVESHPVQVFLHRCQLSLVLRAFVADIHNCVSLVLNCCCHLSSGCLAFVAFSWLLIQLLPSDGVLSWKRLSSLQCCDSQDESPGLTHTLTR